MNIKRVVERKYLDVKAFFSLMRINRKAKSRNGKIKVVFLCQYIGAWNKVEPIYRKMKSDSRFEVLLLCVPDGIDKLAKNTNANEVYDYYLNNGYDGVINALDSNGNWKELEALAPDYVFYLRPYDDYLPKVYSSSKVREYSKICMVMYGVTMTNEVLKVSLNKNFFRNVYLYFAETESSLKINRENFALSHKLGIRKSVYYGMPALKLIVDSKTDKADAWEFSNNDFRVMWTPRWTTDLNLGGTNFFLYKDWLLEYAKENSDIDFLFRPHPLMFDNFVKTNEMTAKEVSDYKVVCESLPNVSLDKEKEYVDSIWNTSVLVTDVSGLMAEYFVTGKPMIFCKSNMILTPAKHTQRMLQGCYIVNTPDELREVLDKLRRGEDELFEIRQKIIKEVFGESLGNSDEKIVNELIKDWNGK